MLALGDTVLIPKPGQDKSHLWVLVTAVNPQNDLRRNGNRQRFPAERGSATESAAFSTLEPMAGIEPATDGLRNRCSTAELHWLIYLK